MTLKSNLFYNQLKMGHRGFKGRFLLFLFQLWSKTGTRTVRNLHWTGIFHLPSQTLFNTKTVCQWEREKQGSLDRKDGGKITMVTANLCCLWVSLLPELSFHPSLHLFVWLFLPILHGCDVAGSLSVANDLRHITLLLLTDSHITARRVMQDERRWWQLLQEVGM